MKLNRIFRSIAFLALLVLSACQQPEPNKTTDATIGDSAATTAAAAASTSTVTATPPKPGVLRLMLSADGKAIVDGEGHTIATFVEGMQVKLAGTTKASGEALAIPGCMCCKDECIAWDNKNNCIKTYSSCTWDFECECEKDDDKAGS